MAVEIDGACGWRGEGLDFGIGAYFEDDAVADGEGLGDGVLGVYGEDVAVDEDEVGRRGLRVRWSGTGWRTGFIPTTWRRWCRGASMNCRTIS